MAASKAAAARTKTSKVWEHFSLETVNKKITCMVYKAVLVYHGSTSVVHEHLRRKHVGQFNETELDSPRELAGKLLHLNTRMEEGGAAGPPSAPPPLHSLGRPQSLQVEPRPRPSLHTPVTTGEAWATPLSTHSSHYSRALDHTPLYTLQSLQVSPGPHPTLHTPITTGTLIHHKGAC
ncbi:zinc finger BED domain-containing protein 1-like [Clarias magur]|uniref:Zinc finger BED domain-containing protein 1-like n=1 Tax=Clarias magur TaxID=1594786 RepID=A0A8J4WQR0_CLAMG|nr:zinc finger BED domain-containing protein 1-like [Clarias magur]